MRGYRVRYFLKIIGQAIGVKLLIAGGMSAENTKIRIGYRISVGTSGLC